MHFSPHKLTHTKLQSFSLYGAGIKSVRHWTLKLALTCPLRLHQRKYKQFANYHCVINIYKVGVSVLNHSGYIFNTETSPQRDFQKFQQHLSHRLSSYLATAKRRIVNPSESCASYSQFKDLHLQYLVLNLSVALQPHGEPVTITGKSDNKTSRFLAVLNLRQTAAVF